MDKIRAEASLSLQVVEEHVWNLVIECYRESLIEVLSGLDKALYDNRDPERYVYKEMRSRDVMTKLGPISLKRRYYWDREEECHVFLLDEAVGLARRQRVSDSVRTEAVEAAVTGGSFRGAAAELERRGCQIHVSHEAVRQWTIQAGKALERAAKQRQELTAGSRRIPVLFIEADGFWPGRQRSKKAEVRLFVIHEGWVKRTADGQAYSLVNRRDFIPNRDRDSWEQLSEFLESEYDLSETWVIPPRRTDRRC